MAETSIYTGSCHCGAVRYEVTMPPPQEAVACNCSLCSRAGWLLAFVPGQDFKPLGGEGELTDYQFARKHSHHPFCRICGVRPFARGTDRSGRPTVAVNLRCLSGFDASALPVQLVDGASY
jgi:hypothetical protein